MTYCNIGLTYILRYIKVRHKYNLIYFTTGLGL